MQNPNQKRVYKRKDNYRKSDKVYVKWKGYDILLTFGSIKKTYYKYLLKLAKNVDLVSLKHNVDKLDIDRLKNIPTNLTDLKNKVEN